MSIKIYNAYVLRDRRRLWRAVSEIRAEAVASVRRALASLYREIILCARRETPGVQDVYAAHRSPTGEFGFLAASRYVRERFLAQLPKGTRNEWDLEVSVAFREAKDGRILVIAYPGSGALGGCLDFLKSRRDLRDFHYQNQADRPDKVSRRDWADRARVWKELVGDKEWPNTLVLEIVTHHWSYDIDPSYEMALSDLRMK